MKRASILVALFTIAGCSNGDAGDDSELRNAARLSQGKTDGGQDLCAANGWYDDGICDDFCPAFDPACASCPAFVTTHSCFAFNLQTCPAGTEPYTDPNGCGCGCVASAPGCPSEDAVDYHSCFALNVWECPEGSRQVVDPSGCGCYCEPPPTPTDSCPSEDEVDYHSCFATNVWTCPAGQRQVIDAGGCGCYCEPAPVCPSETEVDYHSCFTTDVWTCPAGTEQVIDPAGCGCYCGPND